MKQISTPVFAISAALYVVIVSLLTSYAFKAVSNGGKYISEYSEIADLYTPMFLLFMLSILISVLFLIIVYVRISTLKIKWKIPIFVLIGILFLTTPTFWGMLPILILAILERRVSFDAQGLQKERLVVHSFFKISLSKIVATILLYAFYSFFVGYIVTLAFGFRGTSSGSASLIDLILSATSFVLEWFFLYPMSFLKSGFIQIDVFIVPIILCYLWSCIALFPFRKKLIRG